MTYSADDRRLISNSEVQSFKRCRRKWALRYVLGWEKQEQEITGPLPFGTAIHGALERYYGHGDDPVVWWMENQLPVYDLEDKKQEKDTRLGRVMLEGYLDWVAETGIDEGITTVAAEEYVTVPFGTILGVEVHLTGRLDVRVHNEKRGTTYFIDHKTAQNLEPDMFRPEQLMHYDLIEMLRNEKLTLAGGELNKLRKVLRTGTAVPPFYDRQPVTLTEMDLKRYSYRLGHTIEEMLRLEEVLQNDEPSFEYLTQPSHAMSCGWSCDFVQCCKMMDDGAPYREYLNDLYTREPSDYTRRNRADWIEATNG